MYGAALPAGSYRGALGRYDRVRQSRSNVGSIVRANIQNRVLGQASRRAGFYGLSGLGGDPGTGSSGGGFEWGDAFSATSDVAGGLFNMIGSNRANRTEANLMLAMQENQLAAQQAQLEADALAAQQAMMEQQTAMMAMAQSQPASGGIDQQTLITGGLVIAGLAAAYLLLR